MEIQLKIPALLKRQLWALIVMIDFDHSRLCVADYQIESDKLLLWLEDRDDVINSLASCLKIEVPLENLAVLISPDKILSPEDYRFIYPGALSPEPDFILEALSWYTDIACPNQKKQVAEKLLVALITQLIQDKYPTLIC